MAARTSWASASVLQCTMASSAYRSNDIRGFCFAIHRVTSHFIWPRSSHGNPSRFVRFGSWRVVGMHERRDRILACVGTRVYPGPTTPLGNARQERPGASSRFIAQGLGSGTSPKKCRLFSFVCPKKRETLPRPFEGHGRVSRFLWSQLRRIGPGHPLGRDPERTLDGGRSAYRGSRYWPSD